MRALLTQRWRLLTALCITAAGVALGIVFHARPAALPKADLRKLPPFALVYSRESQPPFAREIVWQRGVGIKTARVLCRARAADAPRDFGYLPAPTGAWVFVWETVRDAHQRADHTEWSLVRVADGKRFLVAKAKGASGVLPHWYGESDTWLDLTKGQQKWQVDLRGATPKLDRPLPGGGEDTRDIDGDDPQARAWRQAFVRESFDADRTVALKLFPELEPDPRITKDFVPPAVTVEDWLLMPMGIVAGSGAGPSASPTKRQVACPVVTRTGSEAHLDVYDVTARTRLWGRTAADSRSFRHLRWSPDGQLLSFTQSAADDRNDLVTVVDASSGAEVTRLPHATNAFVVPIVGEQQGQPVIPCACTLKEHQ